MVRYYLDGYYEQNGVRFALEFNGCIHHGHDCRYNPNNVHPLSKVPYSVLRRRFDDKVEILTNTYGLKVKVMWECEWKLAKQHDAEVIEFVDTYKHPERLKPRDSLFGGRTNPYKLYHKAEDDEKIRSVDFTSLYPYGLYHCDEPIWALPILYVFMHVRECVCVSFECVRVGLCSLSVFQVPVINHLGGRVPVL